MVAVTIYARVSDDKLTEEGLRRQDIDRQVERLLPIVKAAHPDARVLPAFIDDGKSAFKDDYQSRPSFCRLLREVRAHRVQRIYIESLDRWSRRVEDGLRTMREVSEAGCTVTSIAEGECDITTPDGWFKTGVSFLMAEWASRNQSHKVKTAMERRRHNPEKICASCGVVHLGRHPFACNCPRCRRRKGRVKSFLDSTPAITTALER